MKYSLILQPWAIFFDISIKYISINIYRVLCVQFYILLPALKVNKTSKTHSPIFLFNWVLNVPKETCVFILRLFIKDAASSPRIYYFLFWVIKPQDVWSNESRKLVLTENRPQHMHKCCRSFFRGVFEPVAYKTCKNIMIKNN